MSEPEITRIRRQEAERSAKIIDAVYHPPIAVGIILGIELSRLARSNKDWHQLIELCAIFRTMLADQDGLYDPTNYNDRLLLGLRGMMSEAELHILQGRMYQAVLNKARRGELYILPPVGYVKLPTGEFAIDPDEQVESVVRLVFDEFDRLGTVRGVVRYLIRNDIKMPIRPHKGPNRGTLEWRRPTRDTVTTILTHHRYKGTYRYGHRQVDPRQKRPGEPGSGRVVTEAENYHALIPDHCPAYITAERYERNQKRLADNRARAESKGSPREGPSLLAGVVKCGRCDRIMNVHYSGKGGTLRYSCQNELKHPRQLFLLLVPVAANHRSTIRRQQRFPVKSAVHNTIRGYHGVPNEAPSLCDRCRTNTCWATSVIE